MHVCIFALIFVILDGAFLIMIFIFVVIVGSFDADKLTALYTLYNASCSDLYKNTENTIKTETETSTNIVRHRERKWGIKQTDRGKDINMHRERMINIYNVPKKGIGRGREERE